MNKILLLRAVAGIGYGVAVSFATVVLFKSRKAFIMFMSPLLRILENISYGLYVIPFIQLGVSWKVSRSIFPYFYVPAAITTLLMTPVFLYLDNQNEL